jgi:hypothetical protein
VLLLLKTPNLFAAVTVYWLALPPLRRRLDPFSALLHYLPLISSSSAMPAAAKLGPAQAAWVYFFRRQAPEANLVRVQPGRAPDVPRAERAHRASAS